MVSNVDEAVNIPLRLYRWNLVQTPTRDLIEELWKAIDSIDNWDPFYQWLDHVMIATKS